MAVPKTEERVAPKTEDRVAPKTEERVAPVRPALPLLLMPLGGLWLGLFSAEQLVWRGVRVHPVVVVATAVGLLALLCSLVLVARGKRFAGSPRSTSSLRPSPPSRPQNHPLAAHPLLALAAASILGLALGLVFWTVMDARAERVAATLGERAQERHTLVILEDPQQGAISKTSLATLEVVGCPALKVRVFWGEGQEPLPLGMRLTAYATFKPLTATQAFLHQKGVFGSITLEGVERAGFAATPLGAVYAFREHNRQMLDGIDGEGSALLRGVLLGDTTELDAAEAGRAFKVTGLAHLVAVSGSHLVVIALLISWLIGRLGLRRPLEIAIITSLLVSYVFLTGLQPSAIRACAMTLIASLAIFAGRRGHIPSALAAAAFGMLLLHPPTAFSVGFWLSVYAVFGLTIFCPLVAYHLVSLLPGFGKGRLPRAWGFRRRSLVDSLADPLALTVTAQMATLPITAPLFATVSLVSPLANLLVTPFITLLVGGGIATVCLMPILGPLGPVLLGGLCATADISILLAEWCARLPYACLAVSLDLVASNVCALALAALIYHRWPQPPSRPSLRRSWAVLASCVLLVSLLLASAFLPAGPQAVVLDVGQGDAILVREGRSSVLIDTGPSDASLLRALARQRVSRLDAVIITHLDEDHCGALDALSGTIPVGHVYFAQGLIAAKSDAEPLRAARLLLGKDAPEELAKGDTLTLGDSIELVMLWPDLRVTMGGNDESVCLALNYDSDGDGQAETRMLLTGDAESPQLASVLAQGGEGRFDILKVGHHGSTDAVTTAQLKQMGCQLALISVGKDNRYGHPTGETLATLDQSEARVYRTDFNGDIRLRFAGESFFVRCDTIEDIEAQ
jgi:competence protein ComEC